MGKENRIPITIVDDGSSASSVKPTENSSVYYEPPTTQPQENDTPPPPTRSKDTCNIPLDRPVVPMNLIPKKPAYHDGIDFSALQIAYFSMEIGLDADMPTYAGGLGVLAGDMMKSCTDLDLPVIGISLLYKKGYFQQLIDSDGNQHEEEVSWNPPEFMSLLSPEVVLRIDGRDVHIRAWMYKVRGAGGTLNPVIFLDTDFPENSDEDRLITQHLYGGDEAYRLVQEAVLGIGGVRMLETLGAKYLRRYHMNEGHSALTTVELYKRFSDCEDPTDEVRRRCVFTTHTPVSAGHDRFSRNFVGRVLAEELPVNMPEDMFSGDVLNMTHLALRYSAYVNGVAKKHGEISRDMFPGYQIESITNGVHANSWVSEPFQRLFDKYFPGWRTDPYTLRYALSIPGEEIWRTHQEAKGQLIHFVNNKYATEMSSEVFTIGFARRATAYKRGNMLFSDVERLLKIARHSKGIQIIYAGKAHPKDDEGKRLIREIITKMKEVNHEIKVCYIENYNVEVANLLVSGVDLWLNTPIRPQEASGTSGMKAALNGIPHFSVLDGWWLEGHIENVTGWSIGPGPAHIHDEVDMEDIEDMYTKLEYVILPRFYNERDSWIKIMRHSIAINGSFFNTHRMVQQYVLNAYFK